jgi:hypothetical protein
MRRAGPASAARDSNFPRQPGRREGGCGKLCLSVEEKRNRGGSWLCTICSVQTGVQWHPRSVHPLVPEERHVAGSLIFVCFWYPMAAYAAYFVRNHARTPSSRDTQPHGMGRLDGPGTTAEEVLPLWVSTGCSAVTVETISV